MVEKEAIAPDERPKVAAVIYNRLKAGMPLGIDATIRYGLDVPATEPLRDSQLESDNPYNTRNRTGLPPTPIANPGLASMQAAAHPAKVDYLYFVRKPDKMHHFFTASEKEFDNTARTATAMDDHGETKLVAPARPPGRALALAADAERRLRGARPRLGLRAASTSRRSGSRRRCAASSSSASSART